MFIKFLRFFTRIIPFRDCPSGLSHKAEGSIVDDYDGYSQWCWHPDCIKAAIERARLTDKSKFLYHFEHSKSL